MKKKIISALLCVAMVATVAVGCGKSSDSKSTDSASSSDSSSLVMPVSATVTSLNGDLETMAEGAFQLNSTMLTRTRQDGTWLIAVRFLRMVLSIH